MAERPSFVDAFIVTWGLAYLVAAVLAPRLIVGLPVVAAVGGMLAVGILLVGSVAVDEWGLYAGLGALQVTAAVAGWTGTIRWSVPYDQGFAAVTMAGADLAAGVVLVYATLRSRA